MKPDRVEFNLHLSSQLYNQISRLSDTGINLSSIARLAIRKCGHTQIDAEYEVSRPKRVLIYLSPEEAAVLQKLSEQENISRAMTLRRLLTTYLRINADAIESLF
jgi:hypothetical protein